MNKLMNLINDRKKITLFSIEYYLGTLSRSNLEMLVVEVRRKPEYPEKNPRSRNGTSNKLNPDVTQIRESNSDHTGGRRVLSSLSLPRAVKLALSMSFIKCSNSLF